jgi:hypothetical protein
VSTGGCVGWWLYGVSFLNPCHGQVILIKEYANATNVGIYTKKRGIRNIYV